MLLVKMAVTQQSRVLTFNGFYAKLARLGLPLPLVASLKLNYLMLESAIWNVRCFATVFSVSLFWPSIGVKKKWRPWRCRQTTQAKSSQSIAEPVDSGEKDSPHNCSVGVGPVQNDPLATPNGAPSIPVLALPPDTPSVSRVVDNVLNVSEGSDEEPAVLDKVVRVALCILRLS